MAGKLDDMIAPDERVVYRVHRPWRELLRGLFVYTAIYGLMWLTWYWLSEPGKGGDTYRLWLGGAFLFLLIAGSMGYIASFLGNRTAVVTNHHFLYKTGVLKPKVSKIPLAHIEGVAPLWINGIFGFGKLRLRTGKLIQVEFGRWSQRLCAAIKAELGLPQSPDPSRKVCRWAGFVWVVPALSLFILYLAVISSPLISGLIISGLISIFEWLNPQQLSIIFYLGAGGVFYLLIRVALLVGDALALCLARVFLSAHEAKQMICLNHDPFSGNRRWERLSRRRIRQRERLLSWLYGQPIRCKDDE